MTDAPQPIDLPQFLRMLRDLETPDAAIAPYVQAEPSPGGGLAPTVKFNPETARPPDVSDAEIEEAALMLGPVNGYARWRRAERYRRKLASWSGPKLVAQGDSWFQYPFLLTDVIDHLDAHYAIRCLSGAGDELTDMVGSNAAQSAVAQAVTSERPDAILLSGGGNDLLGSGRLAAALRPFDPRLAPEEHLTEAFELALRDVMETYASLWDALIKTAPTTPIFVHGYDHAIPNQGPWLGQPMRRRNITDPALQQRIIAILIDRFYAALFETAAQPEFQGRVTVVDCRKIVAQDEWCDELHPLSAPFGRVAAAFHQAIQEAIPAAPSRQ